MVKVEFAKGAKTIQVIQDVYDREQAQEIAEKHKSAAFGTFTNTLRAFDRSRGTVVLTGYRKRYLPFWHIAAESIYEYHRKSTYQIGVRPEVQSVSINSQDIPVSPDAPMCVFEGVDHCFEHFKKETVKDAAHEKGKDYRRYLDAKAKVVRAVEDLQKLDVDVVPVQIRASYLMTNLTKEILKPVHADEILDERVIINRLTLYFTPVHVFEFKEENRDNRGTIEVDGVTGAWEKGSKLLSDLAKKYWNGDTAFDIGTEVAAAIVPGAGVGMILTKKLFDKRHANKMEKQHAQLHAMYSSRKKK